MNSIPEEAEILKALDRNKAEAKLLRRQLKLSRDKKAAEDELMKLSGPPAGSPPAGGLESAPAS